MAKSSNSLVEYTPKPPQPDAEELELKLRRILENVPVRVNNTSGSSAGSGSGDFHQVTRMDEHYKKTMEVEEFNARREERLKVAEERTEKKRLKRQKKKLKKMAKNKKCKLSTDEVGGKGGEGEGEVKEQIEQKELSSDSEGSDDGRYKK
ncbi:hypothetical protein ACHQM5_005636 [Ranunculus cassubicifolius]